MFQRRRWNAAIQSTAFQPPLECIFSDDNYNEPSVSFRSLSLPFFVPFIHYCLERNDFGGRLAVQINAIKRKRERERERETGNLVSRSEFRGSMRSTS